MDWSLIRDMKLPKLVETTAIDGIIEFNTWTHNLEVGRNEEGMPAFNSKCVKWI